MPEMRGSRWRTAAIYLMITALFAQAVALLATVALSVSILGMVSPIKDLDSVRTVNEFLEEIDKQDGK